MEIAPARDPEDPAGRDQAGQQGEAEAGRRAVVPLGPLALDFVQAAAGQAAARQMVVESGQTERRDKANRGVGRAIPLYLPNSRAQRREGGSRGGRRRGAGRCGGMRHNHL